MGKINDVMTDYLRDKERFADLFNANLFHGKEMISPDWLEDSSEVYAEEYKSIEGTGLKTDSEIMVKIKDSSTSMYRDIKMSLRSGGIL